MWAWIIKELQKATRSLSLNSSVTGVDKEDIVSLVLMKLCQDEALAKDIYKNERRTYLYRLVKEEVYEQDSKAMFDNKMQFSRYKRVLAVCRKHDIEAVPENAYKISAILDNQYAGFTIPVVTSLLSTGVLCSHSKDTKAFEDHKYRQGTEE